MKQVGIFTATRWELNAVRRAFGAEEVRRLASVRCVLARRGNSQVWMFQTGVGPVQSLRVCREAFASQPFDVAISSGFACALVPSQIGDLLIGTEVLWHGEGTELTEAGELLECSASVTRLALDAATRAQLASRSGRFVTVPRVAWQAREKDAIRSVTGAVGLDMESIAVGLAARERRVPFGVVRAVSDLLDEDLPLDFNEFLGPAGWLRGAVSCVTHPSSVTGLMRLRSHSTTASQRLTAFLGSFEDCLESGQGGELS